MSSESNALTPQRVQSFKAMLPAEAFRADPKKAFIMLVHTALVAACFVVAGRVGYSWWLVVLSVLAGHSMACVGFLAHDLTHGSILRNRAWCRAAERLFWGLVLIPPTVWRRVHNQSHHVHYNTPGDPDRMFLAGERCAATSLYTRIFYPNAETFPWNPLVLLHLIPYVTRNTAASLMPGRLKPSVVPVKAGFRDGDAAVVLLELLIILLIQAGLFLATGGDFGVYLVTVVAAYAVTSAVSMGYIFTNHFGDPILEEADPLEGSTSVIVPRFIDRLHANFSFHTEHHVLPGLNSDFYPALSNILREQFPDRYSRIPILEAWRRLWRNPMFVALGPDKEKARGDGRGLDEAEPLKRTGA